MLIIVQVTETGEEFEVEKFRTDDACDMWISKNQDNYPESTFYYWNDKSGYREII